MEQNIFVERVRQAVQKSLGEEYLVGTQEILKNNAVRCQGLSIRKHGRNTAPTIYLEGFYRKYEEGSTFSAVVEEILCCLRGGEPEKDLDLDFFRSYEKVRDRICFRLISAKRNECLLQKMPYIPLLDLAIVFFYAYSEERIGNGSIRIQESHRKAWGIGTEELMRDAMENTPRLFPRREGCLTGPGPERMEGRRGGGEPPELIVLSNQQMIGGSAVILYPGVLEDLSDRLGADLYVIPSSVHEVLLSPVPGMPEPEMLRRMIREINRTELDAQEILSDSLYLFGRRERRLRAL